MIVRKYIAWLESTEDSILHKEESSLYLFGIKIYSKIYISDFQKDINAHIKINSKKNIVGYCQNKQDE